METTTFSEQDRQWLHEYALIGGEDTRTPWEPPVTQSSAWMAYYEQTGRTYAELPEGWAAKMSRTATGAGMQTRAEGFYGPSISEMLEQQKTPELRMLDEKPGMFQGWEKLIVWTAILSLSFGFWYVLARFFHVL